MTAIEQAIKEAVEKGGYTKQRMAEFLSAHFTMSVLLDPLFWQALGKARGWMSGDWKGEWHRFIDHLASGGDAESFFANL